MHPQSSNQAGGGPFAELPLIVDLDGTLIASDLLVESFFLRLAQHPLSALRALLSLTFGGRSVFKAELAAHAQALDVARLPYNEAVVDYVRAQREAGREIALVSASDEVLVERVAGHVKLFSWHRGSSRDLNLKGEAKAAWLSRRLPDGFVYAGDSVADLAVWRKARGAVAVGVADGMIDRLSSITSIEKRLESPTSTIATWMRAMRVHQWIKNTLIFIPLFLSGQFVDPAAVARVILGFLAFSLMASAGYLFNDLLDLQADRAHPGKRHRPLASGSVDIFQVMLVAGLCLALGLLGLAALGLQAVLLGAAYFGGTFAYSLWLKRLALVDLFSLGVLFTLRVALGTALIGAAYSTWLLTFSMFFFFALAAVKRVGELSRVGAGQLSRRGYSDQDASLLQGFGVAFSASSLVIFVLYLDEEALLQGNYPTPEWLWLAPLAILLWLCRLWPLAVKGELHDDPVVFAVKDPASIAIGFVLAFSVLAAHLL